VTANVTAAAATAAAAAAAGGGGGGGAGAASAGSAANAGDSEHSWFVQESWLRVTCDAFDGWQLVLKELDIAREAALAAQVLNRASIEP
jgi:hypothetical protein